MIDNPLQHAQMIRLHEMLMKVEKRISDLPHVTIPNQVLEAHELLVSLCQDVRILNKENIKLNIELIRDVKWAMVVWAAVFVEVSAFFIKIFFF